MPLTPKLILIAIFSTAALAQSQTTAWRDSSLHVDYPGIIGRSDIVLAQPNRLANQAIPLGNGRLGVAIWSPGGLTNGPTDALTIQLNRVDTLPNRLALAQLTLPGLAALANAPDYSGRLDLYNAEFHEQGAGMKATTYVEPGSDNLIIDVTGADPAKLQTATLHLPSERTPKAEIAGSIAILSDSWLDNKQPGHSDRSFGTLAAVTADARSVTAKVSAANTVAITFQPYPDGHFRILVAGPHFDGNSGPAAKVAAKSLSQVPKNEQAVTQNREWWHTYWHHADFMKITSSDGVGEYMENLRTLYLFASAAQSRSEYPGTQAGIADLFSSVSTHHWDPAAFWHWNLRMMVAANISAGVPEQNLPYFNLYRSNLESIEAWTKLHMNGKPGICIPETMRFNGPGYEYEEWDDPTPIVALNCAADSKPYYNARTISTGAEVSLWIWQQYLATNDLEFLKHNYPVMREATRFLLSYATPGQDGLTHTTPSNAHETMWDQTDPTTDVSARKALFAANIAAAKKLGIDADLVTQLQSELPKVPELPRTEAITPKTLLISSADNSDDVIAVSYQPASENHNVENIGLEPVWPYDLISDNSPLFAVARRTYEHRPYPVNQDWSYDPIQAARLQLPDEVESTLVKLTEQYQQFINGFANWGGTNGEFYIEQEGVTAAALQEALVQDYDGLIRVNPSFPHNWDVDGQVSVRGDTKVGVQIHSGKTETVVIESGENGKIQIRNPWPDSAVTILSGKQPVLTLKAASVLSFPVTKGKQYLLQPTTHTTVDLPYAEISGTPATTAKRLGQVQIGLSAR
ncbi:glycoside hydrolase family 95 protein [Acidicapsa ligni]|uniref:glycoside hydrolase family 95 protein n=1 Tax=Acidicapsa ligni TaxID=542300 RepID=UPI0021E0B0FB|nr:glycoside hydrolase family 95 protein [Acidicapsa ligni]